MREQEPRLREEVMREADLILDQSRGDLRQARKTLIKTSFSINQFFQNPNPLDSEIKICLISCLNHIGATKKEANISQYIVEAKLVKSNFRFEDVIIDVPQAEVMAIQFGKEDARQMGITENFAAQVVTSRIQISKTVQKQHLEYLQKLGPSEEERKIIQAYLEDIERSGSESIDNLTKVLTTLIQKPQ